METGLYYLNARMYDPVTARFLQADTYAGSQSDPLSLNLYTYCMNNPERYIDPSDYIAIELAVIVISAVVAGMAVEAGIQKFIEKKVCIDYNRIVGEGLFSGAISAISFGTGNLLKCTIGPLAAKNALSTGTGPTAKTLAAALIANAAGGAASEAAEEMAHQFFVEGRTFSQIDYRQIGISAALGTVVSAGSTLAGAGIKQLKAKRARSKTLQETTQSINEVLGNSTIGSIRYSPINPCDEISREVAESFEGAAFTKKVLAENSVMYRVSGGKANKVGSYVSRTPQWGGLQSQIDLALNPAWGNTTENITKVIVPKGTVIYEGIAASQNIYDSLGNVIGTLIGGGNQVYIPKVETRWFQ